MSEETQPKKKRTYRKSKVVAHLSAAAVRSFSEIFLQDRYDGGVASPAVHDEWWEMCCSLHPRVAIAAPRNHAKTSAITFAYTLASILLRYKRYVIIVANTEEVAKDFLGMIRDALRLNKDLRDSFDVKGWEKDGSTDCVVTFKDGARARIMVRGAGQRIRGRIWDGTRPDLIVIDDLEDDEAVESAERRHKLLNWLRKAVFPSVSLERGQVRVVGTILHLDGALIKLINSSAWYSKIYKAHKGFNDFSELLWPTRWTEKELRRVRQEYIDTGDPEGYSQEYLNDPSDLQNPYFREEDFVPMDELDKQKPKSYYVGCDFALSDKKYSNYTVLTVGGYDSEGMLHIVDERRIRTDDTAVIIDELFSIHNRWHPEMFIFEAGIIANAILPVFYLEMRKRNKYGKVHAYTPILDKKLRAASIQQRMRSGGVRYDSETSWYDEHKEELKTFPKGTDKDRVDAIAWLGRAIDEFVEAPTETELEDAEWQNEYDETMQEDVFDYSVTGY